MEIATRWDKICGPERRPLAELGTDPARAELHDAIATTSELSNFAPLRTALAHEPLLTLQAHAQALVQ